MADGRTDAMIYYAAWGNFISAQMKVLTLKGQLTQAVVALELATGLYEIPKPGQLPTLPPTESKKE